jgi:hypothetical protein
LRAYASWFNRNGGAWFAIHPRCADLIPEFPHNQFFIVRRSHLGRLYDDWGYLASIGAVIGRPDVYYAYGVPLYQRFGQLNSGAGSGADLPWPMSSPPSRSIRST